MNSGDVNDHVAADDTRIQGKNDDVFHEDAIGDDLHIQVEDGAGGELDGRCLFMNNEGGCR